MRRCWTLCIKLRFVSRVKEWKSSLFLNVLWWQVIRDVLNSCLGTSVNIVRNDQESRQKSVPDPDPEIRSYKGVVPGLQIIFSVLSALVWSKNKGAPPPGSPLEMQQRKLSCPQELRSAATKLTCHIVVCSSKHDPAYVLITVVV